MLWPLIILAILSVIGGWMGWPEGLGGSNWFAHFLEPAVKAAHLPYEQAAVALSTGALSTGAINGANTSPAGSKQIEMILAIISTLVALAGWYAAHLMYYSKPELPERMAASLRAGYATLKNKYWVDEIYGAIVVAPVLFIARWVLSALIDRGVIDGGTLAAGYTAQGFGALVARIQSGNIRSYAGWLALFAALMLATMYFGWAAHWIPR
jgi:NADH-quinone oxidoreductase subunit L